MISQIMQIIFYLLAVIVHWVASFMMVMFFTRFAIRFFPQKDKKEEARIAVAKFMLAEFAMTELFASIVAVLVLKLLDKTLPWFPLLIFFAIQTLATFYWGKLQLPEITRRTQFIGCIIGLLLAAISAYIIL